MADFCLRTVLGALSCCPAEQLAPRIRSRDDRLRRPTRRAHRRGARPGARVLGTHCAGHRLQAPVQRAASGAYSRPHRLVKPASSVGEPITTSRAQLAVRLRRSAPGSNLSTRASMACSLFFIDSAPHELTCSARAASTLAIASASMISAVRQTMVRTSRSLMSPASNSAPTLGNRSANPAMRLRQRQPRSDVLGRRQLGGHRSARVDPPVVAVLGVIEPGAPAEQLGHRGLLARTRRRLHPRPPSTGIHHRGVIGGSQLTDLGQRTIEPMSEATRALRPNTAPQPQPVDEIGTVDKLLSVSQRVAQ